LKAELKVKFAVIEEEYTGKTKPPKKVSERKKLLKTVFSPYYKHNRRKE
jgi:hypothetical protein